MAWNGYLRHQSSAGKHNLCSMPPNSSQLPLNSAKMNQRTKRVLSWSMSSDAVELDLLPLDLPLER